MRYCLKESEINPAIHEIISGPYASEGECTGGCDQNSSSTSDSSSSSSSSVVLSNSTAIALCGEDNFGIGGCPTCTQHAFRVSFDVDNTFLEDTLAGKNKFHIMMKRQSQNSWSSPSPGCFYGIFTFSSSLGSCWQTFVDVSGNRLTIYVVNSDFGFYPDQAKIMAISESGALVDEDIVDVDFNKCLCASSIPAPTNVRVECGGFVSGSPGLREATLYWDQPDSSCVTNYEIESEFSGNQSGYSYARLGLIKSYGDCPTSVSVANLSTQDRRYRVRAYNGNNSAAINGDTVGGDVSPWSEWTPMLNVDICI